MNFLTVARDSYTGVTNAFINDNLRPLQKIDSLLFRQKDILKGDRRKETLCLRQVSREVALEKSAWFHLANNCCMSVLYNLRRISEICKEHIENNFRPLPERQAEEFALIGTEVEILFNDIMDMMQAGAFDTVPVLRHKCEMIKDDVSDRYHRLYEELRSGNRSDLTVLYVYFNTLQETREMLSTLRKYLRAYAKLRDTEFSGRVEPETDPGLA